MKEEKTVSLKEVLIFLIGNKWLYLIMFVSFLATSLVGFNIVSSSQKEYSAFFTYDVAGFRTDAEKGESYFIDGEKFNPLSLVQKEKLPDYLKTSYLYDGLTPEGLCNDGAFKSFEFKTTYKENENQSENEPKYIVDKQGYEIVFNASAVNKEQAKLFAQMIANEVVLQTSKKIDSTNYSRYVYAYEHAISYGERLKALSDGIHFINSQLNSLKVAYGDFELEPNKYGGDDDSYYVSFESVGAWETAMKNDLDLAEVESLTQDLKANGYIDTKYPEYISSIRAAAEELNAEISANEGVLTSLKTERDDVIALYGSEENAQISEYNEKIVSLTEKIASQKEQVRIYELQLQKTNTSSMTSEELAAYNSKLADFEYYLRILHDKLNLYSNQFGAIAKKTMKEKSHVYFYNSEIITVNVGMRNSAMLVYSLLIAAFLPMAINGSIEIFKRLESKPLFSKKAK